MLQGRAEPRGIVLQITDDEGLHRGVLIVDRPSLTPNTGTPVPGYVGHGEAVLNKDTHVQIYMQSHIKGKRERKPE